MMTYLAMKRTAAAVLIGLAALSTSAQAGIEDYEFQLAQPEVKQDNAAEIQVRLVDKQTGKLVPDAVIFAQRVDMAPDGMEAMQAPIEALPSTEPGVYRFKAQLPMAGGWRLSLGAKVQGETGTVESKLVFKVVQ